ncbi:pyrroloquinoline quinone biosynthesis protein B [Reichenbachiella faecimaris]|uniref:Pyrroloquinoline quinone biosynthesis protein B n=2 Tax=Reichenbachiella faecimaris TaxID=692418 RepID=A0A1W2G7Z7_REIFA|nr:pyrroloquinoline quinone biosynthesis protein B [Reichenbachiella faecimaris]
MSKPDEWEIIILGIAQDAGYPQAGCKKSCCKAYWDGTNKRQHATCLALLNRSTKQAWLFEATPDIKYQMHALDTLGYELSGIFLTHAHVGHYAGLIHLGREVMGTQDMPVFAMPKMKAFLETNGPWSQLVSLNNISIKELKNESPVLLNRGMKVTPWLVPHRDEYSETVGYEMEGIDQTILFIPDINKWETWNKDLAKEIKNVDYALLDASFFADGELPGRDMSKIPHPFTTETMNLLKDLPAKEKSKVHFIHFNHTNPALFESPERNQVFDRGFNIVHEGQMFKF